MGDILHEGQRNSQAPLDHVGERLKFMARKYEFSDTYPADGDPLENLANYFPKGVIVGVFFENHEGYSFEYDEDNETVRAYKFVDTDNGAGGHEEVGNGDADLNDVVIMFVAFGY